MAADRFLGFVRRDGVRANECVAEFEDPSGDRYVMDVLSCLQRQHIGRRDGLDNSEIDKAVADFQQYLDAQPWFDARRELTAWIEDGCP